MLNAFKEVCSSNSEKYSFYLIDKFSHKPNYYNSQKFSLIVNEIMLYLQQGRERDKILVIVSLHISIHTQRHASLAYAGFPSPCPCHHHHPTSLSHTHTGSHLTGSLPHHHSALFPCPYTIWADLTPDFEMFDLQPSRGNEAQHP